MSKEPYIAYPKKDITEDDIEGLVIVRNKYYDEFGSRYYAFDNHIDLDFFLQGSGTQIKWFSENEEKMEKVGSGDTIRDAVDDLLAKVNNKQN